MESESEDVAPEELERRRRWFDWYMDKLHNHSVYAEANDGELYRCPCCGCKTLDERGGYDICKVCYWEDDGQDEADADTVRGGPNGDLSLTQARANYCEFGACEQRLIPYVRAPFPEEI